MLSLTCTRCGDKYPISDPLWQCICGGLLNLEITPQFDRESIVSRRPSLWRYREALPLDRDENILTFSAPTWVSANCSPPVIFNPCRASLPFKPSAARRWHTPTSVVQYRVPQIEKQDRLAGGIAIAAPVRYRQILTTVRESGGTFMTVSEVEIAASLREIATRGHPSNQPRRPSVIFDNTSHPTNWW